MRTKSFVYLNPRKTDSIKSEIILCAVSISVVMQHIHSADESREQNLKKGLIRAPKFGNFSIPSNLSLISLQIIIKSSLFSIKSGVINQIWTNSILSSLINLNYQHSPLLIT